MSLTKCAQVDMHEQKVWTVAIGRIYTTIRIIALQTDGTDDEDDDDDDDDDICLFHSARL